MLSSNKRIAKNTIALYLRQIVVLSVSLYTYRIILANLGVVDFGIYSVVGGVVAMFSLLSNSMSTATTRFLTFDLGKGDSKQVCQTFNLSLLAYAGVSIVIVLIAETLGLWFVNTQLVIPQERMESAFFVYQFAIIAFIATICATPFSASIIAHENMSIYAYVSIFDALFKLLIAFLIENESSDKLILYGGMLSILSVGIALFYLIYCLSHYKECRFTKVWNKEKFFQIFSFAGWNLFGAAANLIKGQGTNILLNIFFGPAVNAARAIAMQINSAVCTFAQNFFTAVQPQIVKNFASNQIEKMTTLMFRSGKLTFVLMLLIVSPLFWETPQILLFWLKQVPESTVIFARLILIESLIESMSYPIGTALNATGKIKAYQSIVGGIQILNLPISFIFLSMGGQAHYVMVISIFVSISAFIARLFLLQKNMSFSVFNYFMHVILVSLFILILATIIPAIIHLLVKESAARLIITIASTTISISFFYGLIGLNSIERKKIISLLKTKMNF